MMTHSIVYIALSLLSLVAVHAMSAPMSDPRNEQRDDQHEETCDAEKEKADRESPDTL
jgi:hypothetical protein